MPNGASFTVPPKALAEVLAVRRIERKDDRLRLLYMGRLDQQKGIDRLVAALSELRAANVPLEARAIGGEILADSSVSWTGRLKDLGVDVRPPVFASKDLIKALGWADVLVMPSRWEGAPLMIAEAQQLGCVPIATAVGAVDELIVDGEDGILINADFDPQVVREMAQIIQTIAHNRDRLAPLMEGVHQDGRPTLLDSLLFRVPVVVRRFGEQFVAVASSGIARAVGGKSSGRGDRLSAVPVLTKQKGLDECVHEFS